MRPCHMLPLLVLGSTPLLAQVERANVLLIMADDMGAECVQDYGGESYRTPQLTRLAAEGMRFQNAHSMPVCTPTRVQLMTGRSNAATYERFSVLAPGSTTFAHVFKDAGYRTAVAGKWQLYGASHYAEQHRGAGLRPEAAGFDTWQLWQVEELGSRYWDPLLERDGELQPVQPGAFGPDLTIDFLLDFLDAAREGPFFAYYPMALPHDPFVRTPHSSEGELTRQERFADMVAHVDRNVGRLLDALDERGLSESTLVVFTADNGTSTRITSQRLGAQVRGAKAKTIDTGTHVPLYLRWTGHVPAGALEDALVSHEDIFATLLEACGLTPPDELVLDGPSYWGLCEGRAIEEREWIASYYWPRPSRVDTSAVRWARDLRYKLYEDGRLYDVLDDPLEATPLEVEADSPEARAIDRLRLGLESLPADPLRIYRPPPPGNG